MTKHKENRQNTVENHQKNDRFTMHFVHDTTSRLTGVTSRSTARKCSPDSVECAKIGLVARTLVYLVIWLNSVRRHLPKMSDFGVILCTTQLLAYLDLHHKQRRESVLLTP